MNLIDRDEVQKLINEQYAVPPRCCKSILELPTIGRNSAWIETKEKLPEESDWVIAVVREKYTDYIWIPHVMEYRKELDDWLFQGELGWISEIFWLEVVAWCPLPEPYKRGTKCK